MNKITNINEKLLFHKNNLRDWQVAHSMQNKKYVSKTRLHVI